MTNLANEKLHELNKERARYKEYRQRRRMTLLIGTVTAAGLAAILVLTATGFGHSGFVIPGLVCLVACAASAVDYDHIYASYADTVNLSNGTTRIGRSPVERIADAEFEYQQYILREHQRDM